MTTNRIKVMGEGGVHLHKLATSSQTEKDGIHKHLFFIGDRLLMTDLSGAHVHPISENLVGEEKAPIHMHAVQINTPEGVVGIPTKQGGSHVHELQVGQTTLSGLHVHELELAGETYVSMLPSDLIQAVEAAVKSVPAFKNFKVRDAKEETPLEMDFELVKRLNKADFKDILKKACVISTIKSLARLKDGLQVESLILSRDRFSDIGAARRFVMDHGMNVKSSEEVSSAGVFVFRIASKDRFVESSLQRIRISDGVIAVVGLFDQGELGQQVQENKPVEAKAEESLTENAVVSDNANAQSVVEGTIDEMQDHLGEGAMKSKNLKERFAKVKQKFGVEKKAVKKSADPVPPAHPKASGAREVTRKFVNWKDGKPIQGTALDQIKAIAEANGITRKFVTVEYPQKRFVSYLTTKFETVHAVYEDSAKPYEEREYKSLHVKAEHLDAFIVSAPDGWRKSLVVFFDEEEKLDDIFTTEIKNYEFGAYQYRQTMTGPVLVPVEMSKKAVVILDEELMNNLMRDTETFFSAKSEQFFKDNADDIDYKRGILMYGPPGNGKTTFIKHFILSQKEAYAVLCEASDFDGDMGKFLGYTFGKDAKKVIVFEDVDSIASRYERRSEFLNFLDGVNPLHKTLIIATTNYPGHLDTALTKRPSRFDQKYKIDYPDFEMRKKFLKRWFKDINDEQAADYSRKCEGFSGAVFKELFILRGLQDITIDEAIAKMRDQMCDLEKSCKTDEQLETIKSLDIVEDPKHAIAVEKKIAFLRSNHDLASKFKAVSQKFKEEPVEPKTKQIAFVEIMKVDKEKRLVTGPVLIPENVDLQDDIISADEIEKAAHNYLLKLSFHDDPLFLKKLGLSGKSKRGFMHVEFNRKIALVESYVAPVDFELNKRNVKQGTWVMSVKVLDDEAWNLVKAGKITGFSIGGRSQAIPERIQQ